MAWPVHLSMVSWNFCLQSSEHFIQANGCFPPPTHTHKINETMVMSEKGMIQITVFNRGIELHVAQALCSGDWGAGASYFLNETFLLYRFLSLGVGWGGGGLRVCSTCLSILKTLWEKEILVVTSNFSYRFYPLGKLSAIFIEFEIVVCKHFQFWRVYLLIGKGLTLYQTTNISDQSKLKAFADDTIKGGSKINSYFEYCRKHCGKKEKMLTTRNFSFFYIVFQSLVFQGRENQGFFRKV